MHCYVSASNRNVFSRFLNVARDNKSVDRRSCGREFHIYTFIHPKLLLIHYEKEVPLIDNVNLTDYTVCNANKVPLCEHCHR